MADQTFRNPDEVISGAQQRSEQVPSGTQNMADQARSAGRDLKEKTAQVLESSSEAVKERASEMADAAKSMASQATDKLKQTVEGQKNVGAEYVGKLADTMRRAAQEFDRDLPVAGTYIRKAADQVEGIADKIRTGNFNDLMQEAQSFARRQPTAFLGMAVLTGFGAVRFMKSSSQSGGREQAQTGEDEFAARPVTQPRFDTQGYRDEIRK
jgi:gas vesicle protein